MRDITQEKRDEQTRQDARIALASINDGFYTLDRNWRLTYVNDRYCEMVGMSPSELLGQNIWELFPAAVDTEAYVQFHQAMADQAPRQFDYLYTSWNCWHDHRIYPSPTGLTVLIADITDRKQAEEALRRSEERFRVALQNTPIVVFNQDRDLRYTWIHNPKLGYSIAEVLGKTDYDLNDPDTAAALTELNQQLSLPMRVTLTTSRHSQPVFSFT